MDEVRESRSGPGDEAAAGAAASAAVAPGAARARAPRAAAPALTPTAAPWPAGARRGRHADPDAGPVAGPAAALPMVGVERRLVRRAEAVWEQLRPPAGLPAAGAIHAFEAPLFADNAALFALPPHPSDPACALPRILRVGAKLAELGGLAPGPVGADGGAGATVAGRLAALVERATAGAVPVVVEIDSPGRAPGDDAAGRDRPGVLLRAIALPFAPPARLAAPSGPLAVVIASWRTLLSADETARLQRELAAALEWLHGTH